MEAGRMARFRAGDHMPRFRDRREAGARLAEELSQARGDEAVVLGIPRGGVVVADEIAERLQAPLDVLVVRKLGYPGHEEAGFGAVGEDDVLVPESLVELRPEDPGFDVFRRVVGGKRAEVAERVQRYRRGRPRVSIAGKTAIVVDDGIATGYTFAAALAIARRQGPRRLIAAAPAASGEGASLVSGYCDEAMLIGVAERGLFFAVSLYYDDFPQVSDEEVVALLEKRTGDSGAESSI
jgi:putative phosphoribosyl transferase